MQPEDSITALIGRRPNAITFVCLRPTACSTHAQCGCLGDVSRLRNDVKLDVTFLANGITHLVAGPIVTVPWGRHILDFLIIFVLTIQFPHVRPSSADNDSCGQRRLVTSSAFLFGLFPDGWGGGLADILDPGSPTPLKADSTLFD